MSRCPPLEQLEGFLEETLSSGERQSIAQHVDACPDCQASLENLTRNVLPAAASVSSRSATLPLGDSHTAFLEGLKLSPPGNKTAGIADGIDFDPSPEDSEVLREYPSMPGYDIVSELGRGGMGVVYKARQLGLDRLVAIKMILAGPHAGPKDLGRFRQEAEAVARLRHVNIVQVYDIAESEGRPYFVLEFIDGGSLAQRLGGTPQPLGAAARLIETLARAIHYAHERNIVHRDLKPANILLQKEERRRKRRAEGVSDQGNDLVDLSSFLPKITDFGLAKRLDMHSTGTQSGEVVGTPSYMAPEQATSKGAGVGPASDVYALGAIFYEMLTGRPPFRGPTALDTVLQVLHEEPVRPSHLRPNLPRDLETICLKCLAKEPGKRYASAEKLADDLQRFRQGKPIKARPVGIHERLWKWARHRPVTAALIAGILLIALVGFAGITWQWHEASRARDDKELERQQAEKARSDAEWARGQEADQRKKARASLYFSRIAQSQLQWRVNDWISARDSLAKCIPPAGLEDHRAWEWHYLQGLYHNDVMTLVHPSVGMGGGVAYDPEGRFIASVVGAEETGMPGSVRIWDARSGQLQHAFSAPAAIHRLAMTADGARLALAGTDGKVMIRNALTNQEISSHSLHTHLVSSLAFSPKGEHLASGGWDQKVVIWDQANGKKVQELLGHGDRVQCVAYHPKGKLLASGSWDATIKIWDLSSGRAVKTFHGHKKAVYCVAFSPDGELLVSAGSNGNIKIWELETGKIVQSLTADTGAVLSISFSPDGRFLAKGGTDGTVRIWDLDGGVEKICFRGHVTPVECVSFSPDCRRVVSLSPAEGTVKVWDLTRHPEFATLARTDADIEALAFQEDGRRLLSVTKGGKLQTWEAGTGMLLEERRLSLEATICPGTPVSFAPGGRRLAAISRADPRLVKIWDAETGTEVVDCGGHELPVSCVRFSSDGRLLATCGYLQGGGKHEIKVWDAASGRVRFTHQGQGQIYTIAFSPDSAWLAWGGQHLLALVPWKIRDKDVKILAHQGPVTGLAFHADGQLLASAGMEDRILKIWKMDKLLSGRQTPWHTLSAPSLICDLAFSLQGRRLAAASRDMVKLWDIDSGNEVLTLRGAPQRSADPPFNARLAFSPDGLQLAGSNWDESISIWEAPQLKGADQFESHRRNKRRLADERTLIWHLQEAEYCLEHANLPAVHFHLERLGNAVLPTPLQERRDRLLAFLKTVPEM